MLNSQARSDWRLDSGTAGGKRGHKRSRGSWRVGCIGLIDRHRGALELQMQDDGIIDQKQEDLPLRPWLDYAMEAGVAGPRTGMWNVGRCCRGQASH